MKALVYIETKDGSPIGASLELMTAANAIGAAADAVTVAAKDGVPDEDLVVEAIAKKATDEGYELVLISATSLGKIVAPRIAARIGGGSVNDAISIAAEDGKVTAVRPVYGGTAQEKIQVTAPTAVISIRGGSYEAPAEAPAVAELVVADDAALAAKIVEVIAEAGEAVNLADAKVIVSGGRGMGTEEDFQMCKELADILGGVVGATRPAIESGWINRTHQVGQSGTIVAPDLYIACGISGATQHISGMSSSKYIIAINKDEDAPIFAVADVGIVGDVKQILPLMIEEFKKRKD